MTISLPPCIIAGDGYRRDASYTYQASATGIILCHSAATVFDHHSYYYNIQDIGLQKEYSPGPEHSNLINKIVYTLPTLIPLELLVSRSIIFCNHPSTSFKIGCISRSCKYHLP